MDAPLITGAGIICGEGVGTVQDPPAPDEVRSVPRCGTEPGPGLGLTLALATACLTMAALALLLMEVLATSDIEVEDSWGAAPLVLELRLTPPFMLLALLTAPLVLELRLTLGRAF
mmetsp:Transcript_55670/g.99132  ORF Transcript_55670/g.99132 Transcript_55670/m.99132 type:complete len:116 (+) Transcript_55670:553-900(+)